jgi:hypothetical protein
MTAVPIIFLMPILMSAFTSLKAMIPIINPFSWDPVFAKFDAIIHGGIQPWELLQPIIQSMVFYYVSRLILAGFQFAGS